MFIGHFGAALALKRTAPTVSLGTLVLCALWPDLLWSLLLLAGIEHATIAPDGSWPPLQFTHYPISHGLAMVVVWGIALGAVYYARRRRTWGAFICAAAVGSHWLLDFLVHRVDLPLLPGGAARAGLGLWQSLPISMLLETAVFGVGVWFYSRTTEAFDRSGRIGFWILVGCLLVVQVGNVVGPPPPNIAAVAWVGQAQWVFVLWAYWVDWHRRARI